MKSGIRGAFVISWSQTDIDGLVGGPVASIVRGSAWAWRGDALRVDGPADVLRLDRAQDAEALRKRATRMVHRLVGLAVDNAPAERFFVDDHDALPVLDTYFTVTDGARLYTISVIPVGKGTQPLLMFLDDLPPRDRDLWVVEHKLNIAPRELRQDNTGGVICFTPGTRIETPSGPRLVEELRVGDAISTRDNGPQEVLWMGQRRMTGARLFAMPHLRPVRLHAGVLGPDAPDSELLVSPAHRILIRGPRARALFNEPEVLASARDLVDDRNVVVDHLLREVTYVHVLLQNHQIITANGVLTESFHPASAELETIDHADFARLLKVAPAISDDPYTYGPYARRNLNAQEAAVLHHAA